MKNIFFTIILIFIVLSVSAQKEVFFNTTKPEDIKVESMHGFDVRISFIPNGFTESSLPDHYNPSIYFGYYAEKSFKDSWTLIKTIGFQNVIYRNPVLIEDSIGQFFTTNDYTFNYALYLEAAIEPRWYFGYNKRYVLGKASLNSGWYLSFPLFVQILALRTPDNIFQKSWFPGQFISSLVFTPKLGYRQAITDRLFLEGSIGFGLMSSFGTNSYDKVLRLSSPYYYPTISLKAAYNLK